MGFLGFLDQLWDDSLAGPCPATGLGKLRKTTISNSAFAPEGKEALRRLRERGAGLEAQRLNDEAVQVTQSMAIIKPPYLRSLSVENPSSPAGLTPQISPCSLTPRERENPWQSNKYINDAPAAAAAATAKKECEKSPRVEPRSPTVYDWVVVSALDG